MVQGTASSQVIKKQLALKYPPSWREELRSMMGTYVTYRENKKRYSAWETLDDILHYITEDIKQRMFTKGINSDEVDEERLQEYGLLVMDFRRLYGSDDDPNPNRKLTLLDLQPQSKVKPDDDKVYISRDIPIVYSWGNCPAEYVAMKIGYVYVITTYTAQGFPMQQQVPMFSWNDKNIMKKKSNCVPPVYYLEQRRKILAEFKPTCAKLTSIIAAYLHRENMPINGLQSMDNSDDDEDGFDEPETENEDDGIN